MKKGVNRFSNDDKFCQEDLYQKLSKFGNWFSSYSRKCRGCFFETQCNWYITGLHTLHLMSRYGWMVVQWLTSNDGFTLQNR